MQTWAYGLRIFNGKENIWPTLLFKNLNTSMHGHNNAVFFFTESVQPLYSLYLLLTNLKFQIPNFVYMNSKYLAPITLMIQTAKTQ